MHRVKLQAHRGVSSECPGNTLAAFRAAIRQGYGLIELDPGYTADNRLVVLHDDTINSTARLLDGSPLPETVNIHEIPYEEAAAYDYGLYFSPRFRGERLPLLEEVFALVKGTGITLKIDNKYLAFPQAVKEELFALIRRTDVPVALTVNTLEAALEASGTRAQIHYDGPVDEPTLKSLAKITQDLTVWLPLDCQVNNWVKLPFASPDSCRLVKKYAKLGIWLLSGYSEYEYACGTFDPDLIETNGGIKPFARPGVLVDMHTHSQSSHDSLCPVARMAEAQREKGMKAFAVTDHFDALDWPSQDIFTGIRNSVREAAAANGRGIQVLTGVELGDVSRRTKLLQRILDQAEYDVVIGSVHTVAYGTYAQIPYSRIDFSQMPPRELLEYLAAYFRQVRDMLEKVPCDILAHLTCPLRYITGIYGIEVELESYGQIIQEILEYLISHGIALEVNTSGLKGPYGLLMPAEDILKQFRAMGGYLITLGSDAHQSDRAANGFAETCTVLKKLGFSNVFYYEKRSPIQCAIDV